MQFDLRKVAHYWGYKSGGYIYYMLAPPWVKFLVNDIVNQHLEEVPMDTESSMSSMTESDGYKKKLAIKADSKKPVLFSKDIEID